MEESFVKYRALPAYVFMGKTVTFGQVDDASRALAAYLQSLGLDKGDRVAVVLPNVPQYPGGGGRRSCGPATWWSMSTRCTTPRELEHQLKDSGAKAIVILENCRSTLAQVIDACRPRRCCSSAMERHAGLDQGRHRQSCRAQGEEDGAGVLAAATPFASTTRRRRAGKGPHTAPKIGPDDIAVLQYTGGTTGVSKGAVLLHRNLVANLLQAEAWYQPALKKIAAGEQVVTVCALPLYHIFGFNTNMMLAMRMGGCNILIPNPRDLAGRARRSCRKHKFHSFPAVNTLFMAMANHPDFDKVDWSQLKISVGGGMAVQQATAQLWLEKTGCPICEGLRPVGDLARRPPATRSTRTAYSGTIGLPLPNTELTR